MPLDKIEKISSVLKKVVQAPEKLADADHFAALMKQRKIAPEPILADNTEATQKINSLVDEVRNTNNKSNPISGSTNDLVVQSQQVISQIDELKTKLQTPNLELKAPVRNILRNKLEHIDESLKIALSKAGGESAPFEAPKGLMSPIDRFLGLLTHGQNQLQTLASEIVNLQGKDGNLTPANMLLIQVKVANISQEIELFTSMLNKALESTKAIMNVQV